MKPVARAKHHSCCFVWKTLSLVSSEIFIPRIVCSLRFMSDWQYGWWFHVCPIH